jgi:4-hydroxybenzoate polyprenyltransferase
MLFLPYTGMCLSFVIWGCLISSQVDFEKLFSIILIYFLSLGVAAHVADSVGSNPIKPWGQILSKKQSWTIIILTLGASYLIGLYYSIYHSPYLIVIGIAEGFFLFAYNFELFRGRFHNNFWFSISWGVLPFFAGFVIQTNSLNLVAIMLSLIPFGLSYLEIKVSRLYKLNKRSNMMPKVTAKYELILKILSLSTISITILLLITVALKMSI